MTWAIKNPIINTYRPKQKFRRFADDIFKYIFVKNINIALKFDPEVRINNIPALVQIMAWRRIAYKPLSEPMMVNLHIYASPGLIDNLWRVIIYRDELHYYWNVYVFHH